MALTGTERHRLTAVTGLAALGLDALASTAYGPEAIVLALAAAGSAGIGLTLPVTLAIVAMLAEISRLTETTLGAALSMGRDVLAVHVVAPDEIEHGRDLAVRWLAWRPEVPLVLVESPQHTLGPPIARFVREQRAEHDTRSHTPTAQPSDTTSDPPAPPFSSILRKRKIRRLSEKVQSNMRTYSNKL